MQLQIEKPKSSDEWSLNICKACNGITEYWNAPGGQSFYNETKYLDNGFKLRFIKNQLIPYDQKREVYEPGLSIIDVLMFNSIKETNILIDKYELLEKKYELAVL